jgi:hypothetical protein
MNYFAITFAVNAHSLSTVSFCETSNDTTALGLNQGPG